MIEISHKNAYATSKNDARDFASLLNNDILHYLPVKLVPAITWFAAILILTMHNMTPVEYGTYSVVMAMVLLMSQIFGTWLSNAVLYVYPDYQNRNGCEFQLLAFRLQGFAAAVCEDHWLRGHSADHTYSRIGIDWGINYYFPAFSISYDVFLTIVQARYRAGSFGDRSESISFGCTLYADFFS